MLKQEPKKQTYEELLQRVQDLEAAALENQRLEKALKESEKKLKKNEEWRQLALKGANIGFFTFIIPGNTLLVDDGWLEILGYEPDEITIDANTWCSWIHPEDQAKMAEAFQDHMEGRSPYYHLDEYRARGKSGEWVWLSDHGKVVEYDADGRPKRLVGIHINITERKKTEEKILRSEQRLRLHSEQSPLGFLEWDENFRAMEWNTACERIFGYTREEAIGRHAKDLVLPVEIHGLVSEIFQSLLNQTGGQHSINENITRDGRIITCEWFNTTLVDKNGNAIGVASIVNDITDRKKAEAEIKHLKNHLANIIDSMPTMLVGMDNNEMVTRWNRQAEAATGIPATEAVGRPIRQMIPDFSPHIEAMIKETRRHRPAVLEKISVEKEGESRLYDLMMFPLLTNGTEGAVLRIEDVTERSRIQEMMVQTEKMMSLGGLAAGMAHEINNPLGIITQAAQNLERRIFSNLTANLESAGETGVNFDAVKAYFEKRQIPEFIGSIREASKRASRIIENILRFSRGPDSAMQPVSLESVIDQALELAASDYDLKKKYDFKSIEIDRDYAPDIPDIPMIAVEMEQVILNLLKNAAQAMVENPPERKPRISIRLRREDRYVLIEVADNGPGMTEEVRRRVFEPFFSTKEPGIGTGLGLSVAYMIVTQNHKGLMEVQSTPGKGTCFRIRLPLG